MANVLVAESSLQAIADAIREKNGTQETYTPGEMADAIEAISGGGITPTGTIEITSNGTYDVTNYASADVDVPSGGITPTGTISITENGTFDVTQYASASVDVRSVLPEGYTEINYVGCDGNAYINTGYLPVQGDDVHEEIIAFGSNFANVGCPLSAGTGTNQLVLIAGRVQAKGNFLYCKYFASGTAKELGSNMEEKKGYIIELDSNGLITLDGAASASVSSGYEGTVDTNLFVGGRANNTSGFVGLIGNVKITNGSTEKLNLIPCRRNNDNKIGFYDTVSSSFMSSIGSHEFYFG